MNDMNEWVNERLNEWIWSLYTGICKQQGQGRYKNMKCSISVERVTKTNTHCQYFHGNNVFLFLFPVHEWMNELINN